VRNDTPNRPQTLNQAECRFWVKSGQTQGRLDCPLSAMNRLMHRSKQHLYSITSSATTDQLLITPVVPPFAGPQSTERNVLADGSGTSP